MRWLAGLLLLGCAGVDGDAGDAADAAAVVDALTAVVGLDARRPADARPVQVTEDAQVVADAAPPDAARLPLDLAVALPPVDAAVVDAVVDARPPPDAAPPDAARCGAEMCNDLDDDCDGRVDEDPVCGAYIEAHCAVTLGWADEGRGPDGISATWSTCPGQNRQMGGEVRCTQTRRDGRFVRLDLAGDVDDNDELAVALHCTDGAQPGLAAWLEQHCAVFLGHADNNGGPAGARWGACPPAPWSPNEPRCTSSGYDAQFRAMRLSGDVDGNDDLGIAWICQDPQQPERALAAQSAVVLLLGWADEDQGAADGARDWLPNCPGREGQRACTSSLADGQFHRLDLGGDVNGDDDLGIALRGR